MCDDPAMNKVICSEAFVVHFVICVVCIHYSQTYLFIFSCYSCEKVFLGNKGFNDVENAELPRLVYVLVRREPN